MNYADLFRVTLPETALEIAALLVLVVDLGFLRKAALNVRLRWRRCWAWSAAVRRCWPCRSGATWPDVPGTRSSCCWQLAAPRRCADWNPGADRADAAAAVRFGIHEAMLASLWPWC